MKKHLRNHDRNLQTFPWKPESHPTSKEYHRLKSWFEDSSYSLLLFLFGCFSGTVFTKSTFPATLFRGCIPHQGSVAPWRVEALHQAPPGLFRARGWHTQLCGDFLSTMVSIKQPVKWKVAHLMHRSGSSHHTLTWVVIYGIAFRIQKDFGYGSLSLSYYVLDSRIDDTDTYSQKKCVVLYSM